MKVTELHSLILKIISSAPQIQNRTGWEDQRCLSHQMTFSYNLFQILQGQMLLRVIVYMTPKVDLLELLKQLNIVNTMTCTTTN